MNITITPAAEKFMRRMVRFNGGTQEYGFRLKVSAGGCSGLASEFTVEKAPLPGDASLDSNGVKVFLPAESRLLLEGATIDFAETLSESGLTFRTPNAPASSCGDHHSKKSPPPRVTVSVDSIRRKS